MAAAAAASNQELRRIAHHFKSHPFVPLVTIAVHHVRVAIFLKLGHESLATLHEHSSDTCRKRHQTSIASVTYLVSRLDLPKRLVLLSAPVVRSHHVRMILRTLTVRARQKSCRVNQQEMVTDQSFNLIYTVPFRKDCDMKLTIHHVLT